MTVEAGETVGLVGESGSGKTTLGRAVLGVAPITSGSIRFDGTGIGGLAPRRRGKLVQEIQIVFQNPYGSLNPARIIGRSVAEPLEARGNVTRRDIDRQVAEMLDAVGLPSSAAGRYPNDFSGGQRQRIVIARALIASPRLIVCDEVTSALDLSVQAQVLNLLRRLQKERGLAYLFISHDLAVVRHMSNRIVALYQGEVVEAGPAEQMYSSPAHQYTQRLVSSILDPEPGVALRTATSRGQ
jgi:peptide/nickel transport system ATP-binding protein